MTQDNSNSQIPKISETFYNMIVDKGRLKKLIFDAYTEYGSARCAQLADDLKALGFRYATQAGVSISVDDLEVPPVKQELLESAEKTIRETEDSYRRGEITEVERFQKVVDTWNSTSESLKDQVVRNFQEKNPLNSVYMMAFSGARGNLSQVRQLVGMRGLMANPNGEIIDIPIKTNFREGLTVTEYIISSYGARKGLVDTALRTADSGYLTRRLVDVSQDMIVREEDCGTERNITVHVEDGDRKAFQENLFGRVLAQDIVDPNTGEVIAQRNEPISDYLAEKIVATGIDTVNIRSPLTCAAVRSVCQKCYGWSLAHNKVVDMGEAVGIIAAQSIGEPGTQLTMRTFHTGGVFTGEVADRVNAEFDSIVHADAKLSLRKHRTPHGVDCQYVETAGDLILKPLKGKKNQVVSLTQGSYVFAEIGQEVKKGYFVAELSLKSQKSTEKAEKDVASALAGEVHIRDFEAEEKQDRQGNITRLASRSGLLWVLSGEVYNLPPSAEAVVKNLDRVKPGDVLAKTEIKSVSGGVVRYEEGSREIEIITDSVTLDKAKVILEVTGGRESYVIETNDGQRLSLRATPGTKVQNHQIVAELIDDRYRTETGGIVKFAGIETASRGSRKAGYEVTQGGTLLWIPEESHDVNKDISLKLVEDGQYVEMGTEMAKDIYAQSSGIVEVIEKNDILREIIVKPGDVHWLENDLEIADPLIQPGTEILPGVIVEELRYAEIIHSNQGLCLLLRPVVEYHISDEPLALSQGSINEGGGRRIELKSIQRLFYKDGDRVKSVEGVSLLSTQLVLEMGDDHARHDTTASISADIELIPDPDDDSFSRLQLVILESITLRRDTDLDAFGGSVQTRILVKEGDKIAANDVIVRTEIQCKKDAGGEVRGIPNGSEVLRRILIVRDSEVDQFTVDCESPLADLLVKEGDFIVAQTELAKGLPAPQSGLILKIEETKEKTSKITFRSGRPYRVSAGDILHIENGDLVQRGDNLVLLRFERPKTGDIIQGLPRIEELLEARKPKEACVLCNRPGRCEVVYQDDDTVQVKVIEEDGVVSEYTIPPNQNVLVTDRQLVDVGEPLTDGQANPHEILEVFYNYYSPRKGEYDAALIALQKAQEFLKRQVQAVYKSQGIDINPKHIEVIVRQMTSKVRVDDGGDTIRLPGEFAELREVQQDNETMAVVGGAPVKFTPILLGITKASLNTDSFISAASFQETTRVLTEAAIRGESDWLRGLKENVIIGRLIPAGTGFNAGDDSSAIPIPADSELDVPSEPYAYEFPPTTFDDTEEFDILDDQKARAYTRRSQETGTAGTIFDDDESMMISDDYGYDEEDFIEEEDEVESDEEE